MLDYCLDQILLTYKQHNIEINPKFKKYISERKEINSRSGTQKPKYLYKFLTNLNGFISVYLTKNYNEILDIIETIFHGGKGRLYIKISQMYNFINLTDKQIQEIAGNKDLYRYLLIKHSLKDIDFNNIEPITNSKIKNNTRQEKKYIRL